MNMAGVAVFDDCPVSRGENEGLRPCSGDEEAVGRIGVSLPGQECALRGRLRVERLESDAHRRESVAHPVSKRHGELKSSFGMLDSDFPDRDGRDPQALRLSRLVQLPDAVRGQLLAISLGIPEPGHSARCRAEISRPSALSTSGDGNSNDGGSNGGSNGGNDGGNNGGNNGGGDNGGGNNGGDGSAAPGTTVHDQGPGSGGNDGSGNQGGSADNGNSGPGGGEDDGNGPFIQMGPERLDVRQLASLSIVPDTSPGGDAFTIGHATGMSNDNFSTFSDFIAQLASDLASGNTKIGRAHV